MKLTLLGIGVAIGTVVLLTAPVLTVTAAAVCALVFLAVRWARG